MNLSVRRLGPDDADAAQQLGFEAFGLPSTPPTEPARLDQPGRTWFGAFDGDTLVGKTADRDFDSCFGGVVVPTSGIASVTVAAEFRGAGALSDLFAATLRSARDRGAVLSTLFPTAPRIYRRFGYEVIADFATVSVPTHVLSRVTPVTGVTTRRATADDVEAVRAVYGDWAIDQNGPLTRRGASFPATAPEHLARFTGISVAEDANGICGYAAWNRGQGYGEHATLEVGDLLARTPQGYQALLIMLGSFASVTPTTKIDTSGDDLVRTFLPSVDWQIVSSSPYMLKIIDVPLALSARRCPPGLRTELRFVLEGDFLSENDGSYALRVADGVAGCSRGGAADRTFTPHGLALMYAGAQSCANLRAAGHLRGGELVDDLDWDALFGGRQRHIRNYF